MFPGWALGGSFHPFEATVVSGSTDSSQGVSLKSRRKKECTTQLFCAHWSDNGISCALESDFVNIRPDPTGITCFDENCHELEFVGPLNARFR